MKDKERADSKQEQQRKDTTQNDTLSKSDLLALILAALSYILPVFGIVLLVLALILMLVLVLL